MDDKEEIYTEEERESLKKTELAKLRKIFKSLPGDIKKTCEGLIEHAAFQRVLLDELSKMIQKDGLIEVYINGPNQMGFKKSTAVDAYDKAMKTYSSVIKQLCEYLKDANDGSAPGAELLAFVNK